VIDFPSARFLESKLLKKLRPEAAQRITLLMAVG
jgi:hypothetical protein